MVLKSSDIVEVRYSKIHNDYINNDIKIACLSDTHISRKTTKEDIAFMIYTIKKENPDYIFLLGDIIDSYHLMDESSTRAKVTSLLVKLSEIAKVFFVIGNHDYIYYDDEFGFMEGDIDRWDFYNMYDNIKFINNEIIDEENIVIGGYNEPYRVYHNRNKDVFKNDFCNYNLEKVKGDKPKVLLLHSPDPFKQEENIDLVKDYNIIMSGHTHNGCVPSFLDKVWIPKHSGIITSSRELFPKDVRGIKKLNTGSYLYHNGGWTKIANSSPKKYQILDSMCNRQIDITTITNDQSIKNIKVYTKKYKKNITE